MSDQKHADSIAALGALLVATHQTIGMMVPGAINTYDATPQQIAGVLQRAFLDCFEKYFSQWTHDEQVKDLVAVYIDGLRNAAALPQAGAVT